MDVRLEERSSSEEWLKTHIIVFDDLAAKGGFHLSSQGD